MLVGDGQPHERVVLEGSKLVAATAADTEDDEINDIEDADAAACEAESIEAVLTGQLLTVGWIVY